MVRVSLASECRFVEFSTADHGPMGQRELGQAMATDPSILVTLLNPLEADGMVARTRDRADRRRHVVTVTPKGKRKLDRAAEAQRQAEDAIFAALSTEQRAQLRDLLIALRDSKSGCLEAVSGTGSRP